MLDQSAIGLKVTQEYTYSWRDVILYNLGVGAGAEDLDYIYEKHLHVIPTFGVLPCTATFGTDPYSEKPLSPTSLIPGLRTDGSLHMDHTLRIHRPIETDGKWKIEKKIVGIYDRGPGKGAKIDMEVNAFDKEGNLLLSNTIGYLNRWAENCGGRQAYKTSPIPERKYDMSLPGRFLDIAPALYRLNGDVLPIHVDPEMAKAAGLPRTIIHGLCSLGHACRILIGVLFPGEPERMTTISVRFSGMAFPGDAYFLQVWRTGAYAAAFRMVSENSGKAILNDGNIAWV